MHKNVIIFKEYGNIKINIETDFNNYGQTKNVEIFGKLAQQLSRNLKYNDTITIEFIHRHNWYLPIQLLIVEKGNVQHNRIDIDNIYDIKKLQEGKNSKKDFHPGISIRVLDTIFDIKKHLKILEYCILNKIENTLNKQIFNPISDDGKKMKQETILYYGLRGNKIKNILSSSDSKNLLDILDTGTVFTNDDSVVKGVYKNGSYNFHINDLEFKTKNLVYIIEYKTYIFIFDATNEFVFLSNEIDFIKRFKLDSDGGYPYYLSENNHFNTTKPLDDGNILLYRPLSDKWNIFSIKQNKIVIHN